MRKDAVGERQLLARIGPFIEHVSPHNHAAD
jgi:hypothetical protein